MRYCVNRRNSEPYSRDQRTFAAELQCMFAVNSLQNLLLATRKTEGFPPRTARFRCRFAADAAKSRGRGGISGLRRTSGGRLETALPVAAAAPPEVDRPRVR